MSSGKTKHQQILEYIRDAILSGKYSAGDRLPTDGQLVRQFSASRPTVARAMRDLEKEGFLERRTGSGSFVRMPVQTRPSLIGLLAPEVGNAELFEPICNEIANQCQKKNLSLLWADPSPNSESRDLENCARQLCERYLKLEVAGVFFAPVEFSKKMIDVNREIADMLDENGISVVLLDRDLEWIPERSRFDLISVDNFRVGWIQADHLIKLGSKRLAYVARSYSAPTIELRMAGFQVGLSSNGITPDLDMIFCGRPNEREFVESVLAKKPDAIVCSNDTTAAMLMGTLLDMGVAIPDDVRIVGVDDVAIASKTKVPLTTVRQSCREIGSAAVQAMVKRIENRKMAARSIFVDTELVIRDSCGASQMEQVEA